MKNSQIDELCIRPLHVARHGLLTGETAEASRQLRAATLLPTHPRD
jgi:hypothetical protein